MSKLIFAKLVNKLHLATKQTSLDPVNKKTDAELLDVYWQLLSKYSIEWIEKVVDEYLLDPHDGRFFPAPVKLVERLEKEKRKANVEFSRYVAEHPSDINRQIEKEAAKFKGLSIEQKKEVLAQLRNIGNAVRVRR